MSGQQQQQTAWKRPVSRIYHYNLEVGENYYNPMTAYIDNKRHTIFDQKKVALHYAKGWFILDFIGTFPFELVPRDVHL